MNKTMQWHTDQFIKKKKQAWINNGIISLTGRLFKAPMADLLISLLIPLRPPFASNLGSLVFKALNQAVLQVHCGVHINLHNGKDYWVPIRGLSIIVYSLLHQLSFTSRSLPALHPRGNHYVHWSLVKWACKQMTVIVEYCIRNCICHGTVPRKVSSEGMLFNNSKMQQHLIKCLEDGYFICFWSIKNRKQTDITATKIPIHCA